MDNRAVALKLILDRLGTTSIATVDDRMEVQKAIYLVQEAGVGLGYSYGWYVKGPYSPALTRDYFDLADDEAVNAALREAAADRIDRVGQLMNYPINGLDRPRKLELLASLHYLLKKSALSEATARKKIAEMKPHLSAYCGSGLNALRSEGFL